MSDAIGALRARVKLQSPTRVAADEIGGAAIAWSDEGEVWAEVDADSAGEAPAFDAAPSVASFRATINRRDDVRAGWRIAWGARRLRITGVVDDGAPRIQLNCHEETL
ncbi:MAG: phage head closure protein [Hyphomonadaceae bacterium]